MTTNRARASEEEYFARKEAEHRCERAEETQRQTAHADKDERDRLQILHFMRCPKCGMALEPLTVEGVEIERCRSCNGTWLDEGKLEQVARRQPSLLQKMVGVFRIGRAT